MNMDQLEQLTAYLVDELPQPISNWIKARTTEQQSTPYLVLCDILGTAYMATQPMSGPCSRCDQQNLYVSLDKLCPTCHGQAIEALLARSQLADRAQGS